MVVEQDGYMYISWDDNSTTGSGSVTYTSSSTASSTYTYVDASRWTADYKWFEWYAPEEKDPFDDFEW